MVLGIVGLFIEVYFNLNEVKCDGLCVLVLSKFEGYLL